ncbi:MAG: hypothetical protein ACF787_06690 [Rhodopirellula sp. JB053]
MSMEENPYSPSTLDVDDAFSVPILNRAVCYGLALVSAGGFLLAVLLILATLFRVMRFAFFVPASILLFNIVAIVLYVGIAYGFIVAIRKSLRMDVRAAFYWAAACALSLGFVMRFGILIEWAFRRWGGGFGVLILFGGCMLLVYRKSSFRTFRSTEGEAALVNDGGASEQNQRDLSGPTLHCTLCAKEVQVDEDERCTECCWPV